MPTDGICLQEVTKTIKGKVILDNVTVEFPAQCISSISGPNGSGKTMLLRAIAGVMRVDAGVVRALGDDITAGDSFPRDMGFVIEPLQLWDDTTGFGNLKALASIRNVIGTEDIRRALARVGLDPNDPRRVKAYSLGMRQRLCIAQAIMERPRLILLDEPTSALDDNGKDLIRQVILEERQRGATIVFVSHDAAEITALSDKQFRMNGGRIQERHPS